MKPVGIESDGRPDDYRPGELRDPLDHGFRVVAVADVALGNGHCGHRRDRRDHGIVPVDGREVRGERRTTPAHRFEIGHCRIASPFCSRIRTCAP